MKDKDSDADGQSPVLDIVFSSGHIWFSDAGGRLVCCRREGAVPMESMTITENGPPVLSLVCHRDKCWAIRDNQLAGFQADGSQDVWGPVPAEKAHMLILKGDRLLCAGDEHVAVLQWNNSTWEQICLFHLHKGETTDMDLSDDGTLCLIVKDLKQLSVYSADDGSYKGGFSDKNEIWARFDTDAMYIYRTAGDFLLKRVLWKSGRGRLSLDAPTAWNRSLARSADGSTLVCLTRGDTIAAWDISKLQSPHRHSRIFQFEPVEDPSEERFLSGMGMAPAAFKDWGNGLVSVTRWKRMQKAKIVYSAQAVSSDGGHFALGGFSGELIILDGNNCSVYRYGPDTKICQPPCCEILWHGDVRALYQSSNAVQVLKPDGSLIQISAEDDQPRAEEAGSLPLKKYLPDYWHQNGQFFRDSDQTVLLEKDVLSLFNGRELLSHQQIDAESICPVGEEFWFPDPQKAIKSLHIARDKWEEKRVPVTESWPNPQFDFIPAGCNRFLLCFNRGICNNVFYVFDTKHETMTEIGRGLRAWPGIDRRHFAFCRDSWGEFELWDGNDPENGPLMVWEDNKKQLAALGQITPDPERKRIYASEKSIHLLVFDWQGRLLARLQGHSEWIAGIVPSRDDRGVISWDRSGIFRYWRLDSGFDVPDYSFDCRFRGDFTYLSPSRVRLKRKELEEQRVLPDPQEILDRIEALKNDPQRLRIYAWTLPEKIDSAVEIRLNELLDEWRPQKTFMDKKVNEWVRLTQSGNAFERSQAAAAFLNLSREGLAGLEVLPELLKDEDENVRWRAAKSLGALGHYAAPAAASLAAMLAEDSKDNADAANFALRDIGKPAVPALCRMLKHKKADVRDKVLWILRDMGKDAQEAVPVVAETLSDRSSNVKRDAVECLCRIGVNQAAIPALINMVRKDPSCSTPYFALRQLKEGGDRVMEALFPLLEKKESRITELIGSLAVTFPEYADRMLPDMRRILAESTWAPMAGALAKVGTPEDREQAIARMRQLLLYDERICRKAISELVNIENIGHCAIAGLADLAFAHENIWVRTDALEGLSKLGTASKEYVGKVMEIAQCMPEDPLSRAAKKALVEWGEAAMSAGPFFMRLFSDKEASERSYGIEGLVNSRHPETLAEFRKYLDKYRQSERNIDQDIYRTVIEIAKALVLLDETDEAVDLLAEILGKSHDRWVIGLAVNALVKIGDPGARAIPALQKLLDSPSWLEVEKAIAILEDLH